MSITTVQVVLNEDARWAVKSDAQDSSRVEYPSRGAAIAAGMQMAIEHDAVLTIHGIDDKPDDLFFKECEASLLA